MSKKTYTTWSMFDENGFLRAEYNPFKNYTTESENLFENSVESENPFRNCTVKSENPFENYKRSSFHNTEDKNLSKISEINDVFSDKEKNGNIIKQDFLNKKTSPTSSIFSSIDKSFSVNSQEKINEKNFFNIVDSYNKRQDVFYSQRDEFCLRVISNSVFNAQRYVNYIKKMFEGIGKKKGQEIKFKYIYVINPFIFIKLDNCSLIYSSRMKKVEGKGSFSEFVIRQIDPKNFIEDVFEDEREFNFGIIKNYA